MTTPRIEEMVEEFKSEYPRLWQSNSADDITIVSVEKEILDWLHTALTQAHQAGFADGYKQGKFDAEVTAEYGEPEALRDNK